MEDGQERIFPPTPEGYVEGALSRLKDRLCRAKTPGSKAKIRQRIQFWEWMRDGGLQAIKEELHEVRTDAGLPSSEASGATEEGGGDSSA